MGEPGARRLRVVRVYKGIRRGGGVHGRLMEILPRLAEHVDVRVLCYRGPGERAAELEALGVPVDVVPMGSKWSPSTVGAFVRYFARFRPDVVHTHEYTANTLGVVSAARAGIPVRIRHIHTMTPFGNGGRLRLALRRRVDIAAARRAQLTLAVSKATRARYLELTGLPADSCRVLYNGIDLARFAPCRSRRQEVRQRWDVPSDAFVVGTLGRLTRGKGLGEFLAAASRIARRMPGAFFVAVGEGGERARLERIAREAGIAGRVRFPGYTDDVPGALGAMDLFVFPSRSEGLPGAVIEAQAAGLPVIGLCLPFMEEVVEHGVTGLLVPPGDGGGSEIAEAVSALASRPEARARMGRAARERARRFSLEACVDRTLRTYEALYARAVG